MDSITNSKRPCFLEDDDGLFPLVEMEAGFSGNHNHYHYHYQQTLISRSMGFSSSVSSPRSGRFYDARFEDHQPHFLEACFLCKKPLGDNRDIFIGDTPFCSEECRQEQIEIDEAKEKNWNISSSMKALRKKEQRKSTSPNKTQDYPFRTSTVAAA
ncbi:Zf-FLZ domain containing protein [Quillaja saponaria]|uniref:Zf-FLZ domain containing protein n=1 Tax=Quillaja saponaria TaxID=32244 RepID=A0AAD7P724_QUISA|nr:Zf-FLZ domain containing protein [Quillaja saponaria]